MALSGSGKAPINAMLDCSVLMYVMLLSSWHPPPTSPVLSSPLYLLLAVCVISGLMVMFLRIFGLEPPRSIVLMVQYQGPSCNSAIWLSQGVDKPSPSSLKNVHLYLNFVGSLPEVIVTNFVYPLYSQNFRQKSGSLLA